MDMERQGDIQSAVEKHGREDLIVLLGATDVDAMALAAETVISGDPSYAGPLAGVSLGLPVYHILEAGPCAEIPAALFQENLALVSMAADVEAISRTLEKFRSASTGG
jgi:betaine reductase